jgi:hypothetical protein
MLNLRNDRNKPTGFGNIKKVLLLSSELGSKVQNLKWKNLRVQAHN